MKHQRRFLRALAALVALAWPMSAPAHEIPARVAVRAWVVPRDTVLTVYVRVPLEALRDLDFPERTDGALDLERVRDLLPEGAQLWVVDAISLFADGTRLAPAKLRAVRIALPNDRSFGTLADVEAGFRAPVLSNTESVPWRHALVDVQLEFVVPRADARLALAPALGRLGVRTVSVLQTVRADGTVRSLSYEGDPELVDLDPRWWQSAGRFLREGFWHILGGIDHLLFVLCLVLPIRRWRPLVALVTAFTVAHSITLGAAALGVAPSAAWFPAMIEAVIAGSILWLAVENVLLPPERLERRWPMAFGFGLVHGFGFSFALREELQYAGANVMTALATFNLGVELGQLLVLAIALPVLKWLSHRLPPERRPLLVWIGSAFIAHTAWHWMAERWASVSAYDAAGPWPAVDGTLILHLTQGALVGTIAIAAAWVLHHIFTRFLQE